MTDTATDNKARVRAFFAALEAKDASRVAALFAEDGTHVNPYHSGMFPEGASGRAAIEEYWGPAFGNFGAMTFRIDELLAMEDPTKVFVRYTGQIERLDGGPVYTNDYYSTFTFDENGLIRAYVEIFNPIVAAKAFGMME